MAPSVRIITDSVADLPQYLVREWQVDVIPIYLHLNGVGYRDDGALSHDWFYDVLATQATQLQTAAPSVAEFRAAYARLAAEGAQEILGLFVASSVSSLTRNARQAAQGFEAARVRIVETAQVSMGIGWQVLAAAEAATQGASAEEIALLIEAMHARTYIFGMLDSLDHLQRGGRVTWTQARIAQLLKIKPLIVFYEGAAQLVGRVRTRRRALQWLAQLVERGGALERLALIHSRLDDAALQAVIDVLGPYAPREDLLVVEAGPIFGTHVGPGGVGVALIQSPEALPLYQVMELSPAGLPADRE